MTRHVLKLVWNRKRASALIIIEIFFSFLVLFGVLTGIAGVWMSWKRPLGFQWKDVWDIEVNVANSATQRSEMQLLMRELQAMPEVVNAAIGTTPPYSMSNMDGRWVIEGRTVRLTWDEVSDDYDKVMQMKVINGRSFRREDDALGYVPVVIDSDLARALYDDRNPIGKKFDDVDKVLRVIGVVEPYRKNGEVSRKNMNMVFRRLSLVDGKHDTPDDILVRMTEGTPLTFEETLVKRLHAVSPNSSFRVRQMSRMRDGYLRLLLFPLVVAGLVAAFLIAMVTLGLSGVLWQSVTRRTAELGLRRAVGATRGTLRTHVLAEVALLTTLAVVVGVVVVMQFPLLGIFTVVTPEAFSAGLAASLAMIYALTLVCGMYPGWLASRVQPAQALHYE